MTRDVTIVDSDGKELRLADRGPGGEAVSDRMKIKATIMGALQLLQEVAHRDDNPRYRREARQMADELKGLLRPKRPVTVTLEETVQSLQLEEVKQLPEPRRALGNDIIDV